MRGVESPARGSECGQRRRFKECWLLHTAAGVGVDRPRCLPVSYGAGLLKESEARVSTKRRVGGGGETPCEQGCVREHAEPG